MERGGTRRAVGWRGPARAIVQSAAFRLGLAAAAAAGLSLAALRAGRGLAFLGQPLFYFLVMTALVKLLGDLAYFVVSPHQREIARLDDYLANDFFLFARFGLPLAICQTLAQVKGLIPQPLLGLWLSPLLATAVYLADRALIEKAQGRRRFERGGVPLVRRRRGA